jgi:hypothetical protein
VKPRRRRAGRTALRQARKLTRCQQQQRQDQRRAVEGRPRELPHEQPPGAACGLAGNQRLATAGQVQRRQEEVDDQCRADGWSDVSPVSSLASFSSYICGMTGGVFSGARGITVRADRNLPNE